MLLEFGRALELVDEHIRKSGAEFSAAWTEFNDAKEEYEKARKLRNQILQSALNERGLAVCAGLHFPPESSEEVTAEQLGIYPRDQMKLYYYKDPSFRQQGEYEDYNYTTEWMKLLCPNHFPQKPAVFRPTETGVEIKSGVMQKGEKFILEVNGDDVTKFVNENERGLDVEPNGSRYPRKEIYRYFGIPDLPEIPTLDSVKYGG